MSSQGNRKRNKHLDRDLVGKVVSGKYQVLRILGQGGFGAVYLVEILSGMVGEQLALKVLPAELGQHEASRERFLNEIRLAMKLVHKYIVQIRDVGLDEDLGLLYYTMDYSPGRSLAATLAETPRLAIPRSIAIVRRVLRGVQVAHSHGVIHRDLKPGNIMVESGPSGETIRILDFGIATAVSAEERGRKRTFVGSPYYMPPEQFRGDVPGPYTDLYSVGMILYECLTGERPHEGKTVREILESLRRAPATPPVERRPEISGFPGLNDVVVRAIRREPRKRYQSASEFSADLRRILESKRIAVESEEDTAQGSIGLPRRTGISAGRALLRAGGFAVAVVLVAAAVSVALREPPAGISDPSTTARVVLEGDTRREAGETVSPGRRSPDASLPGAPGRVDPTDPTVGVVDAVESSAPVDSGTPRGARSPAGAGERLGGRPERPSIAVQTKIAELRQRAREGDWARVVALAAEIDRLDPRLADRVRQLRGVAEHHLGRHAEAVASLVAVSFGEALGPPDVDVLWALARSSRSAGELERAYETLEALIEREPDQLDAHRLLLDVLEARGAPREVWEEKLAAAAAGGVETERIGRLREAHMPPPAPGPDRVLAIRDEAARQFRRGEFRAVVSASEPAYRSTRDRELGRLIAASYLETGRPAEARKVLQELRSGDRSAPSAELELLLARALLASVEEGALPLESGVGGALRALRGALEMIESLPAGALSSAMEEERRAEIHTYMALAHALRGSVDGVEDSIRTADRVSDRIARLLFVQGKSYRIAAVRQKDEAVREATHARAIARLDKYTKAAQRSGKPDPRAFYLIGASYQALGGRNRLLRASTAFARAENGGLRSPQLFERWGDVYEALADGRSKRYFTLAAQKYEASFDLEPTIETCRKAAFSYDRGGAPRLACDVLRRGLERFNGAAPLHALHTRLCGD